MCIGKVSPGNSTRAGIYSSGMSWGAVSCTLGTPDPSASMSPRYCSKVLTHCSTHVLHTVVYQVLGWQRYIK